MNKQTKTTVGIVAAALLLFTATAAIASYVTRETMKPAAVASTPAKTKYKEVAQAQPVQHAAPAQPKCDDSNIVGTAVGGVAGGIAGNQIGNGKGKTVATIGGVLGGAYLGNQYIPTRNVTCRN